MDRDKIPARASLLSCVDPNVVPFVRGAPVRQLASGGVQERTRSTRRHLGGTRFGRRTYKDSFDQVLCRRRSEIKVSETPKGLREDGDSAARRRRLGWADNAGQQRGPYPPKEQCRYEEERNWDAKGRKDAGLKPVTTPVFGSFFELSRKLELYLKSVALKGVAARVVGLNSSHSVEFG